METPKRKYPPPLRRRNGAFACSPFRSHCTHQVALRNGATVTEKNKHGNTALIHASWYGQVNVVKWLLANRADINETNCNGYTALLMAARYGHLQLVRYLLENGACTTRNLQGNSLLLCACEGGHVEVVSWLLQNGHSADDMNKKRKTPLLVAAQYGNVELVKFLVNANPKVLGDIDSQGYTALVLAAKKRHYHVIRWLLENGATASDIENTVQILKKKFDTMVILKYHLEWPRLRLLFIGLEDENSLLFKLPREIVKLIVRVENFN